MGRQSCATTSIQDPVEANLFFGTDGQSSFIFNDLMPITRKAQDRHVADQDEGEADDGPEPEHEDASSDAGDDVNALSAPLGQPSSYVGPSSTMQMFRTILRIAPEPRSQQQPFQSPDSQRSGSLRSPEAASKTPSSIPVTERISTLIDAYFAWVHPATPILNEMDFRQTALSESRNDPPWLCLFNIILALGSIGSTRTDSKEHLTYYNAAKSHLDLEALGTKSFETLQALILMSGWYNHYRNRPNLASALLGAAFRMAYALGLHKELRGCSPEDQELRRTIWWNLVVFDAAEAVTLGRTLDTKIFDNEVQCPKEVGTRGELRSSLAANVLLTRRQDDTTVSPSPRSALLVTIGFSRVMSEIQGRLMIATTLPFSESLSLDAHLVDWYEALPTHFHVLVASGNGTFAGPLSKNFVQPFLTIKWRYLNLRLLLYRPSLMDAILHRIPFSRLTSDQRLCIRKCLTLSGETIDSVRGRSPEPANQYIAWPSTWYLLQISMVPLLSLYVFREDVNDRIAQDANMQHFGFKHSSASDKDQVRQIRDECHRQVRITLQLMKEMEPWAVASGKMHDLVSHLYEARDQHLRVWNNTEESPVLILGSPNDISIPHAEQSRSGARDMARTKPTCEDDFRADIILQPEYPATRSTNPSAVPMAHPQSVAAPHNAAMNQFEHFSRDWSMYSGFAWPNATLESLFDVPDEFQYMSQDPFGTG